MKRSISLLSVLAFVLVFSGSAFAQNAPDITASADIVQDLSFTKNNDLSFGQISNSQTANAVLDPNGTDSDVGNNTTYGEIEIAGAPSSSIIISFNNVTELSDGSTNTIGFTADYSGSKSSGAAGSTDLNTGSSNTVTTEASNGKYFIYYGGTLAGTDINGTPTGTYEATISTTINYE
jgi:hypothetical protein